MKKGDQTPIRTAGSGKGFTLIEMLIVIIILGILAMVIVPQITISQDDAKLSTLKTNLGGIRSAIELYYTQHGNTYPGVKKTDGSLTDVATIAESATAFVAQMAQFTDAKGGVSATQSAAYPFGPYLKGGGLPANPYSTNTLLCDISVVDITLSSGVKRAADGTTGWKYLAKLGVLFANDEVSAVDEATYKHKIY